MAGSCGNDHPQVLVLKEPLPFSDEDVTFRLLSLNVCCTLASLAVGLSVFHIMQHALHCLRSWEQKHIIRILAVIPVYAWTTFFSYLFFGGAVYWELIRECYAAYATVSFFTLMCHYIAPNLHEQKNYFRSAEPKNWGWPLNWVQKLSGGEHKGWLRKPRCGVTWFNINYIGIFQYVVLRTIVTIISGVTQLFGRLCKEEHNPRYASTWTAIFDAVSILIAMYCMHQVYDQLKEDLAPNKPVLKMVCVKLIVFLTYWQTWLISLLIRFRVLHETRFISLSDIHLGIPCLLTCAETLVFAILHYWAFPWRQYDIERLPKFPEQVYECGPNEALLEAASPWDYCCATARGFRWLLYGIHFRNASLFYEPNYEAEGITTRVRDGTQSDPMYEVPKGVGKHNVRKDRKTA